MNVVPQYKVIGPYNSYYDRIIHNKRKKNYAKRQEDIGQTSGKMHLILR